MIGELQYAKCSRADGHFDHVDRCMRESNTDSARVASFAVTTTKNGMFLFSSHSHAIQAMEAAGWRVGSESIGGDVCAACVGDEEE